MNFLISSKSHVFSELYSGWKGASLQTQVVICGIVIQQKWLICKHNIPNNAFNYSGSLQFSQAIALLKFRHLLSIKQTTT